MKKLIFLIFISFVVKCSFAYQHEVIIDSSYKLPANEKLYYRVYYQLGDLWVFAAFATFNTDTITYDSTKAYKLYVDAYSRKKYNWIYSLEDHYTSISDYYTFRPLKFEEYNIENKKTYNNVYTFDWNNKVVTMLLKKSGAPEEVLKVELPDFITDSYSAVHYIRFWDYSRYNVGDTIAFETMLDGKIFKQGIVYLGKEKIKDKQGNEIDAFKIMALIKNSTFFSKKKGVLVWVADNNEKWIIKVKAKILVGNIIVFLDQEGVASFDIHKN
jgi:hypothetical protein